MGVARHVIVMHGLERSILITQSQPRAGGPATGLILSCVDKQLSEECDTET